MSQRQVFHCKVFYRPKCNSTNYFFLPWLFGTRVPASRCDGWLLRQTTSCVLVERKFAAVPRSEDRPKQQFALCALITCAGMWNCLPLLNDLVAGASRTNKKEVKFVRVISKTKFWLRRWRLSLINSPCHKQWFIADLPSFCLRDGLTLL